MIKKIQTIGNLIALVNSSNTARGASMKEDNFRGLTRSMHLCVGSWVVFMINLLNLGLANGSTGVVKDIVYDSQTSAPGLPKYIWVDFREQCTGETFFPENDERRGWFPVHPVSQKNWTADKRKENGCSEHTRSMIPLKCSWGWTIWKC